MARGTSDSLGDLISHGRNNVSRGADEEMRSHVGTRPARPARQRSARAVRQVHRTHYAFHGLCEWSKPHLVASSSSITIVERVAFVLAITAMALRRSSWAVHSPALRSAPLPDTLTLATPR